MLRHFTASLNVQDVKKYFDHVLRAIIPDLPKEGYAIILTADQHLQVDWVYRIDPEENAFPVDGAVLFDPEMSTIPVSKQDLSEVVASQIADCASLLDMLPIDPKLNIRIDAGRFLTEDGKLYFVPDRAVEFLMKVLADSTWLSETSLQFIEPPGATHNSLDAADCLGVLRKRVDVFLSYIDLHSSHELLIDAFVIARVALERWLRELPCPNKIKTEWMAQLENLFSRPLSAADACDSYEDKMVSASTSDAIQKTVRGYNVCEAGVDYFVPFAALSFAYDLLRTGHTRNDGFYFKAPKGGNSAGPYFDVRTTISAIAGPTDDFVRALNVRIGAPLKLDSSVIAKAALKRALNGLMVLEQYKQSWLEEIEKWSK